MDISIYMKGYYKEFHALKRRKNKANSKPNKANRQPLAGNPRHEARNPKQEE